MARNVFISFRFSDGHFYKDELAQLFDKSDDTVDCSEDKDRSKMNDQIIKDFLYAKLKRSSITIVLLTPKAINYNISSRYNTLLGKTEYYYDDWIYDEVRYSLENRFNNPTNGLIAVYVPETERYLFRRSTHICPVCNKETDVLQLFDFDNLVRKNMTNIHERFKLNKCPGVYDGDYDSYCSLVEYNDFKDNYTEYIEKATKKRNELFKYKLYKMMKP